MYIIQMVIEFYLIVALLIAISLLLLNYKTLSKMNLVELLILFLAAPLVLARELIIIMFKKIK